MSLASSTPAQRAELVAAANMLAKYLNDFTEDYFLDTTNAELLAHYQGYIDRLNTALTPINAA